MLRSIAFDMGDGLIHPIDQTHGDNHVHEFTPEIIRRRLDRARNLEQFALGAHLDPGLDQILDQNRAVFGVKLPVDQQTFRRTANPGAPGFRVQHHAARLVQIGVAVGIDVADPLQMGKDRNAGLGLHQPDQTLAAARHDHVDIGDRAQHFRHHPAVARRHQLDGIRRQTGLPQPGLHTVMDHGRGMKTFRPAAQNNRITRLKTQRAGIRRHIGAAFIDDANHPQRCGNPLKMQTIRAVPFRQNPSHRVFLFRHRPQTIDNVANAPLIQPQPIHHGRAQPLGRAIIHVLIIGILDVLTPAPDLMRRTDQGGIFAL